MLHLILLLILLFLFLPVLILMLFGVVMLGSFGVAMTIPRQLWELAKDARVRRNHALEHAALNIIEERYGATRITGEPSREGFILRNVDLGPDEVMNAAVEGWRRLSRGEADLAVHDRCGTSMSVPLLLLATTFLTLFAFRVRPNPLGVIGTFVLVALLAKPLGKFVQRRITTDAAVDRVSIDQVVPMPNAFMVFGTLAAGRPTGLAYLVRTHHASQTVKVQVHRVGETPGPRVFGR
jgi:hypothetical protein